MAGPPPSTLVLYAPCASINMRTLIIPRKPVTRLDVHPNSLPVSSPRRIYTKPAGRIEFLATSTRRNWVLHRPASLFIPPSTYPIIHRGTRTPRHRAPLVRLGSQTLRCRKESDKDTSFFAILVTPRQSIKGWIRGPGKCCQAIHYHPLSALPCCLLLLRHSAGPKLPFCASRVVGSARCRAIGCGIREPRPALVPSQRAELRVLPPRGLLCPGLGPQGGFAIWRAGLVNVSLEICRSLPSPLWASGDMTVAM